MKKLLCSIMILVMLISAYVMPSNAKTGDVIGEVVYTDISAYINHYPISAYAYDGGMVVVAEDLNNYGFNVTYDDASRSLSIMPDYDKSIIGMSPVYKNALKAGSHFADALSSDINVYFNGTWVNSCAINGYMMVKLEDLTSDYAGTSFTWDNGTRSAKLWINWSGIADYMPLVENPANVTSGNSSVIAGYYSEEPWCPDFGAMTGATLLASRVTSTDSLLGHAYVYSILTARNGGMTEYMDFLEDIGFIGNSYQGNIIFLKGNYSVTMSLEGSNFFIIAAKFRK